MRDLLENRLLWTAILADLLAQGLKVTLVLLLQRRWQSERIYGAGGMPSAHSAFVSALATGVAITEGVGSPLFAVTAVLGLIVIYDAMGVRRAAGQQALVINELILSLGRELGTQHGQEKLKTLLGHTLPQVIAGIALGIGVGLLMLI